MAAVLYVRLIQRDNSIVTLLASKTKVAPVKTLTTPRLELCAAVLLCKLVSHIYELDIFKNCPVHLWSDNTTVLAWLNSSPHLWQSFVAHRIAHIQTSLPSAHWHHIEGEINPADPASRGISCSELINSSLWWHGPDFLSISSNPYPVDSPVFDSSQCPERRKVIHQVHRMYHSEWEVILNYSSLSKLRRIIAWCIRFIGKFKCRKSKFVVHSGYLRASEIQFAEILLIRRVQIYHYFDEYNKLSRNLNVSPNSDIYKLNPFHDESTKCIRVGGRLIHSSLDENQKHPFVLPEKSHFSYLIAIDSHLRALHAGTQLTLTVIRESFWIARARRLVKSVISKCIPCVRQRALTVPQQMGNLPLPRVNRSDVFYHVGIDYAGPIKIRSSPGRGFKALKGYIAVFVCFSTKAIHLEAVSSLETQQFLHAFKRFVSRRGLCKHVYSDCGTNFVGADSEIQKFFKMNSAQNQEIVKNLSDMKIEWHFNPPAAPHFGGLWEAAVKSVKFHLQRVIGETAVTYEELSTLLTCIEACLNSRPLTPLLDDSNELSVLTPAHFLIGRSLLALPEETYINVNPGHLKRWQMLNHMRDCFWKRWCQEYLISLQSRGKWVEASSNIKPGSIVLIKSEITPPTRWPLARIIKTIPGKDGLVRVVELKTATSNLLRSVAKIVLLPVEIDQDIRPI